MYKHSLTAGGLNAAEFVKASDDFTGLCKHSKDAVESFAFRSQPN